jgi:hypothetical protein
MSRISQSKTAIKISTSKNNQQSRKIMMAERGTKESDKEKYLTNYNNMYHIMRPDKKRGSDTTGYAVPGWRCVW